MSERVYLWCMRPVEGKNTEKRRDVNQKRCVEVCKKLQCKFLETKEDGSYDCHVPTSLQYLSGLKKVSKEEVDKVRAERKAGRRLDDEEDKEEEKDES